MQSVIISEEDFQKARKRIKENSKKKIIFSSENEEIIKKILEKETINVLLLNLVNKKDRFKQRDSGFDSVLARLAKKKNVIIGINLDEVLNSEKREKSDIISRIRQNVRLCNKNKLKMEFISSKKIDKYNLKSLGLMLGMPTWMTKEL